MTLTRAEKFVIQLLISAPNFSLPATEVLAAARASNTGSPATIQRAGTTVATKKRRNGISLWTLLPVYVPAEPASPTAPDAEQDSWPYDGWQYTQLRSEAERRGYQTDQGYSTSEAELELLLICDDNGWLTPATANPTPVRRGAPLPY